MHRRETIMQAITAQLTGLGITGGNVERGRVWPINALPNLTIAQGADTVDDGTIDSGIMRQLNIEITATVSSTNSHETDLNAIAAQVYSAMVQDRTQGLAYVYDTNLLVDGDINISAEQENPAAQLSMVFAVQYEHNDTSTEA